MASTNWFWWDVFGLFGSGGTTNSANSIDYDGERANGTPLSDVLDNLGGYDNAVLAGGDGNDTYLLSEDALDTTISETAGIDRIHVKMYEGDSYTMPAGIEELVVDATVDWDLFGNDDDYTDGVLDSDLEGKDGVTIHGNGLDNVIVGGDLADMLRGNDGFDSLSGGLGADTLVGGSGDDELSGGLGTDSLDGGSGNDVLHGGPGWDTLAGGTGDDTYILNSTTDTIIEAVGGGIDTIVARFAEYDMAAVAAVENLVFTKEAFAPEDGAVDISAVTAYGNALGNAVTGFRSGTNYIDGRGGNDLLKGGIYNDTLEGGTGQDTLEGDSGADMLRGGDGEDLLRGSFYNDWLDGGTGNDTLDGGSEDDVLVGGDGQDSLLGGEGNDSLSGGADADRLEGGAGRDTIHGGAGADWLTGGADRDVFRFTSLSDSSGTSRDTIADFEVATVLRTGAVAANDRIDLAQIDANTMMSGNQAFTWVSASKAIKSAGDLWAETVFGGTVLRGDVNGDGAADFSLWLSGVTNLTASDIIL